MHKIQTNWSLLLLVLVLLITPAIGLESIVKAKPETPQLEARVVSAQQTANLCAFITPVNALYLPLILRGSGNTSVPQPMERLLKYQVGKTYVYNYQMLNYSLFGTVSKDQGVQAEAPSTTLAYGQARVSITGMEGDDVFVGYIVLSNPVICQQNPGGDAEFMDDAEVLTDLGTPMLFKQDTSGKILDVQVADTVDLETANYLKGVLNSLQATLSEVDTYSAEENGGQGVYTVQYTGTLQHNGLQLKKHLTDASFTEFYSQGDFSGVSLDNQINMLLDRTEGVFSQVSFNEVTDILTEDPTELDLTELEGVAMWGTSRSQGSLKLSAVEDTPTRFVARATRQSYVRTGLGADLGELEPPTYGIDLDTLDLEAELDTYTTTCDTTTYLRMRQIMIVDSRDPTSNPTLTAISDRLINNLGNEDIANCLIDLLGNDGSPSAQAMLRRLIDPTDEFFARVSSGTQQQVFANLSLLTDPQRETYNIFPTILNSREATDDQKGMALLAWGTMGKALTDTNPAMSDTIYNDLASRLSTATTPAETKLILRALGNTGHPNLPNLLAPYLPFTNPDVDEDVQAVAFWALRLVPGSQAEELLIKAVDNDDGLVKPIPQDMGATALKNRPGKPSDNANDTLAGYHGDPPKSGGSFKWYWDKALGGERLGGSLPGSVVITATLSGVNAQAVQDANFYLNIPKFKYYKAGTAASLKAWSFPVNTNVQKFGYSFQLFDQDIKGIEYDTPCANSEARNINNGSVDIFDASFKYPVWWILKVGVDLNAVGTYTLDLGYNWDLCTPVDITADLTLTATAKVHVSAFGYAEIWPVRGGPKLDVDVIHATVPGNISASYKSQDGFEACLQVPATLKAGDVSFYIYAERWKLSKFDWDKVYEYNDPDWNFTLWTGNFDIVPKFCFPK